MPNTTPFWPRFDGRSQALVDPLAYTPEEYGELLRSIGWSEAAVQQELRDFARVLDALPKPARPTLPQDLSTLAEETDDPLLNAARRSRKRAPAAGTFDVIRKANERHAAGLDEEVEDFDEEEDF